MYPILSVCIPATMVKGQRDRENKLEANPADSKSILFSLSRLSY